MGLSLAPLAAGFRCTPSGDIEFVFRQNEEKSAETGFDLPKSKLRIAGSRLPKGYIEHQTSDSKPGLPGSKPGLAHLEFGIARWKLRIIYSKLDPDHFKLDPAHSKLRTGRFKPGFGRSKPGMSPGFAGIPRSLGRIQVEWLTAGSPGILIFFLSRPARVPINQIGAGETDLL
jgi:hypothetical protein